jgi:putative transposase
MAQRRYSAEQIVAKLREAEKLQGQGMAIPQSCRRLGMSDQTFLSLADQVRRPEGGRGPATEGVGAGNSRLKRIVADLTLDLSMLKDLQKSKW